MLRVVLAVLLAVAICSVSLAALDDARTIRTERELHGQLTQVARTAADLHAADDAVAADSDGARRVLTLRVPGREFADASVETVEIGAGTENSVFAYELTDGHRREIRRDVPIRAGVRRDSELVAVSRSLELHGPGTYRLVFELIRIAGRPTVLVRHAEI